MGGKLGVGSNPAGWVAVAAMQLRRLTGLGSTCCVTLGRSLNLSGLQFSHL